MWKNRKLTCLYCGNRYEYRPSDVIKRSHQSAEKQEKRPILVMIECPKCLGPHIIDPIGKHAKVMTADEAAPLSATHGLILDSEPTAEIVDRLNQLQTLAKNNVLQGDYSAAIRQYQQSLKICPNHPESWYNMGTVYAQAGKVRRAISAFQKAVRYDPQNARSWNNLGMLLLMSDRIQEADECFDQGIRADPDYPKCYLGKGNVCVMTGDNRQAREYFNLALRRQPDYFEAQEALRRLNEISR